MQRVRAYSRPRAPIDSARTGSESSNEIPSAKPRADHSTQTPAPLSAMAADCSGCRLTTTGRPSAMYSYNFVGDVDFRMGVGKKGETHTAAEAARAWASDMGSM